MSWLSEIELNKGTFFPLSGQMFCQKRLPESCGCARVRDDLLPRCPRVVRRRRRLIRRGRLRLNVSVSPAAEKPAVQIGCSGWGGVWLSIRRVEVNRLFRSCSRPFRAVRAAGRMPFEENSRSKFGFYNDYFLSSHKRLCMSYRRDRPRCFTVPGGGEQRERRAEVLLSPAAPGWCTDSYRPKHQTTEPI